MGVFDTFPKVLSGMITLKVDVETPNFGNYGQDYIAFLGVR